MILSVIVREHSSRSSRAVGRRFFGATRAPLLECSVSALFPTRLRIIKRFFHFFHLLEPDHCLRLSEPTRHLKASPSVSRVKETTKVSYPQSGVVDRTKLARVHLEAWEDSRNNMGPKKSRKQEGVRREGSVGASSQAKPVRRKRHLGHDQARAARTTGADATDALTGGEANSSSTAVMKEEDPALSNSGPWAGHGSPALPESVPREGELQVPSVGGPVVLPKGAVAFSYPALSTGGPRIEWIASREQEGRRETSTVSWQDRITRSTGMMRLIWGKFRRYRELMMFLSVSPGPCLSVPPRSCLPLLLTPTHVCSRRSQSHGDRPRLSCQGRVWRGKGAATTRSRLPSSPTSRRSTKTRKPRYEWK